MVPRAGYLRPEYLSSDICLLVSGCGVRGALEQKAESKAQGVKADISEIFEKFNALCYVLGAMRLKLYSLITI